MALVLTYDVLYDEVIAYLERADARLIARIPLFIMLAQRRVATKLKVLGTKQTENGLLTPSDPFLDKDVRWLANESFTISVGTNLNKRKQLYHRSQQFCKEYWPDVTKTGEPAYYTTEYNLLKVFFVPTPALAYPYESIYWATPQLLDETYDSNFLTTGMPRLLLYATLCETAPYLHDDDRVPMWQQSYAEECVTQGIQEDQRVKGVHSAIGNDGRMQANGN